MNNFLSKFSNIRKLVVAVVGLSLMIAAPFVPGITETQAFGIPQDTLVSVVVAVLTAIGVYSAPNTPQA